MLRSSRALGGAFVVVIALLLASNIHVAQRNPRRYAERVSRLRVELVPEALALSAEATDRLVPAIDRWWALDSGSPLAVILGRDVERYVLVERAGRAWYLILPGALDHVGEQLRGLRQSVVERVEEPQERRRALVGRERVVCNAGVKMRDLRRRHEPAKDPLDRHARGSDRFARAACAIGANSSARYRASRQACSTSAPSSSMSCTYRSLSRDTDRERRRAARARTHSSRPAPR